ncbi:oxidoreductase [Umezawaea beigongshangensis]|uniref:oxidoreductase n=1 Tax=Umezawaea beigongshangensis TaxID=2780383 RepID=UPI0018F18057|nr:oxidoreductase [Umezawaea beigongshangensis]
MGLWDRLRRKPRPGVLRTSSSQDTGHLRSWAAERRGVEAFVEPRTTVTDTTVVLVAHDGEWTRRRVDGSGGAKKLARELGIPVYDAGLVGYPQRMRDWTARNKRAPGN